VRVAHVQRACDAAGASVVIVSGWRKWAPVAEIAAMLKEAGLVAPVLGAVGGVKLSADLRAMATREWLDEHPEVTRWVVIDDTAWLWAAIAPRRGSLGASSCRPTGSPRSTRTGRSSLSRGDPSMPLIVYTGQYR